MIYLKLFISFLQIGMFSFGGGYAAMPLIQGQVVNGHQWLTMAEFTDLITISQMTPGPIAVNSATFVGTKIAGVPGAVSQIPEHGPVAGRAGLLKTCGGRPDRLCGHCHFDQCLLGKQRADYCLGNQLDHGGNLCDLCSAAAEGKDESDPGHGAGRSHEGSDGPAHWRIMKIVFILCPKP